MRILVPTAIATALLLSACGGAVDDTPGVTPPATEVPAEVADGERFGFLVAVDGDVISFDEAEWVADDNEPNGYRIENDDQTAVELRLADDASIEILRATGDPSTAETVDADGLADWLAGLTTPWEAAFDVTVQDGAVTHMAFRYRP